jgi:hypothetical protein
VKNFFLILSLLLPAIMFSQTGDSTQRAVPLTRPGVNASTAATTSSPPNNYKPEIFTSGFIDIINNGQVNASARFVRLYIGEPGKFALPLSLYSGVSSNSFQNSQPATQRSNDALVTNFINPLSGLANISVDGILYFKHKKEKMTKAGFLYHFGERILTGITIGPVTNPTTGKPVNFLNSFGSFGLYFQTGAWEMSNKKNLGVSWFAFRYIGCYTNPGQLKKIMPDIKTNGVYTGYSIAWGVEITKVVNIKAVYYKYTKKPEIDYHLPIYQFSFNYTMKN